MTKLEQIQQKVKEVNTQKQQTSAQEFERAKAAFKHIVRK